MIPQLKKCVDYFKKKILDKVDARFWVAGGAVRDYFVYGTTDNSSDIDLFFPNKIHFTRVYNYLKNQGYVQRFESNNSLKMSNGKETYDLVKILQHDPNATIFSFDFTVCCCAVDRFGIYHHETFFIDLVQKRLIINELEHPFNTNFRIRKYLLKGFYIDNENMYKVIKKIREAPEKSVPQAIKDLMDDREEEIIERLNDSDCEPMAVPADPRPYDEIQRFQRQSFTEPFPHQPQPPWLAGTNGQGGARSRREIETVGIADSFTVDTADSLFDSNSNITRIPNARMREASPSRVTFGMDATNNTLETEDISLARRNMRENSNIVTNSTGSYEEGEDNIIEDSRESAGVDLRITPTIIDINNNYLVTCQVPDELEQNQPIN